MADPTPDPVSGSRVAVGVDIGGTATKAALVSETGTISHRTEHVTDPDAGTKGIVAVVEEMMTVAEAAGLEVVGVGVGAAGFIDFASGSVTFAPNLVYDDPAIGAAVEKVVSVPVAVDNDGNAAAWGERTFGVAPGANDLVLLTLGTGIGSGIIQNGRLVRGHTGAGAEFGHTIVEVGGPQCGCGLRGCIEQLASGQAIERMAREAVVDDPASSILDFATSPEAITGEDVAKAAREMDGTARAVLRRAGTYLGIGMSNIANLFDPEVIVLSGSVVGAGEPYLGPARDTLAEMTASQKRRPMRVVLSTLEFDAGIAGAAALAFDKAGDQV
ncbi:MAG: ROK family protein [Actinobacteria bacterium]|nr:ROK family protein [Actinomycetota bacterium]